MKVIGHRGLWERPEERNTEAAFRRCFELGLGTETDIRDCGGRLVISHDIPLGDEMPLLDFLALARSYAAAACRPLTLALNVKSDGLAERVAPLVRGERQLECFFFDMSVPDMRAYLKAGLATYCRVSEVEPVAPWRPKLAGYWLDAFDAEWYADDDVRRMLTEVPSVAVVSPELHGRTYEGVWRMLRAHRDSDRLVLCTDHPREALEFFS